VSGSGVPAPRGSRVARIGALCVGAFSLLVAPPALAWNAHGHMLIALVAYDALPEPKRASLATLLESHPRYRQDLLPAVPASLESPRERARWLFAHAATWPDLARGQAGYDHGTWHYVNLPLTLRRQELVSCRDARRDFAASVQRVAAIDAERRARGEPGIPAGDSIRVALPANERTLLEANATPEARALALSWVLHLVGDAHQPLHGVALFNRSRFVAGDRGGNDILVRGRASLHRVWDELLGDDTAPAALDAGLAELGRDRRRWRTATEDARPSNVDTWIDEGCQLARRAVYVPAVLTAVERFEHGQQRAPVAAPPSGEGSASPSPSKPDRPEVSLPDGYIRHATDDARERAIRAGLRLAALLSRVPF
jgi:hypothetical protein